MLNKQFSIDHGTIRKFAATRKRLIPILLAIFLVSIFVPITANAATGKQIDVKSFGAKGDGVTDDTTAVQNAINSAVSGDTVLFNGIFSVRGLTLSGKSNISFTGTGTLKLRLDNTLLAVTNAPGFRMEGLTLDGNSKNPYLMDITSSSSFVVQGNTFKNLGNGTSMVIGLNVAPGCNNGLIKGNTFQNIVASSIARGIYVSNFRNSASLSSNITIVDNHFKDIKPAADGDGVVIDQQMKNSNILISSNTFENIHKRGIKVWSNGVRVENNTITRNNIGIGYGAMSGYGNDNIFENNKVLTSGNSSYYHMVDIMGNSTKVLNNTFENASTANNSGNNGITMYILASKGYTKVSNIEVTGNTFKNVRYGVANLSTSPIDGLTVNGNKFYGVLSDVINFTNTVTNLKVADNYSAVSPTNFIRFYSTPNNADIMYNTANAKNGFYYNPGTTTVNSTIWGNTNNGAAVPNIYTSGKPIIMSADPKDGDVNEPLNKAVTIDFNENIKAGSAYADISVKDSANAAVSVTKSISGSKLVITPTSNLKGNTKYTVSVPELAVLDVVNKPMAVDYTFSFTTEDAQSQDIIPPTVTAADPVNGSTNVPVDKLISVNFSENIQPGTTYNNIAIIDSLGNNVSFTKSITGNRLNITPNSKLAYNVKYMVLIPASSLKDMAGNYLMGDYGFQFTTIADTEAPSVPANLTATALSTSSIELSWAAAVDNAGVDHYVIYKLDPAKGFAEYAVSKETKFDDTSLAANSKYFYYVVAVDAAGNKSLIDEVVKVTTLK